MYENMSGPVGFAMHEDRLARAAKNVQISEALAARKSPHVAIERQTCRQTVAKVLIAFAARLAPALNTTQAASNT